MRGVRWGTCTFGSCECVGAEPHWESRGIAKERSKEDTVLILVPHPAAFHHPDSFASEQSRLGCFSFLPDAEPGEESHKGSKDLSTLACSWVRLQSCCKPRHFLSLSGTKAEARGRCCSTVVAVARLGFASVYLAWKGDGGVRRVPPPWLLGTVDSLCSL